MSMFISCCRIFIMTRGGLGLRGWTGSPGVDWAARGGLGRQGRTGPPGVDWAAKGGLGRQGWTGPPGVDWAARGGLGRQGWTGPPGDWANGRRGFVSYLTSHVLPYIHDRRKLAAWCWLLA